jgi:hypothetical protein
MTDYTKGKIYSIRSSMTDKIYIGSTTQTLCRRLSDHRKDYNKFKKGCFNYISSFDLLKLDDHYIELLELFPCTIKSELRRKEGQIIREYMERKLCVNRYIAGNTKKESNKLSYEKNKEKILEQCKQYRQKNQQKKANTDKRLSKTIVL